MDCTLGVDVGTSGAKAIVVDAEGRVLARGSAEYPLQTPAAGWAEQDPEDWVQGAQQATAEALQASGARDRVGAVGFTGQMHSAVFLDASDRVLRPAILWCDQRTVECCETLTDRLGGPEGTVSRCLNKVLPGFTAPKVLWLAQHEPQHYRQVRRLLVGKDYVRFRWTGVASSEVTDASGTLLLDVPNRCWSPELMAAAGVDPEWLGPVTESHEVAGQLSAEVADALGLRPGIPVVAGAGDQAAGALGCGLAEAGFVSVSLGTSGVVFGVCEQPLRDAGGSLHSFAHAVPGRWHGMGVVLSAGGAIRWFRDALGEGGPDYARLDAEAADVAPGSEGICFLPYLTGERTPIDDPAARGAFAGLDLRHGRAHLARSVLEGVSFALGDCFDLARRCGLEAQRVRVTGGGARSPLLLQILASVFGCQVHTLSHDEGPAFGAAMLAAASSDDDPRRGLIERSARWIVESGVVSPEPAAMEAYGPARERYRSLYQQLRPLHTA